MTRTTRLSARRALTLGREIQEQYDHGAGWATIAADFDLSESKARRLARAYRQDCDRKAHRHQLILFG